MKKKPEPSKTEVCNEQNIAKSVYAAGLDAQFQALIAFFAERNEQELFEAVQHNLRHFEGIDKQNYDATVRYYNKYRMWGEYYPDEGVWELAKNRAQAFALHRGEFEWLYDRLGDYRSKRVLHNILSYWLTSDYAKIVALKDKYFKQYFDPDLIRCDENEVLVDIGAYLGDTVIDYVNTFGDTCYKRIYCYEIVPDNVRFIHRNIELFHLNNVVVRELGVSDRQGTLYLPDSGVSSVKKLSDTGAVKVQTVAIDEDIDEPVTFIKMDIEGAEEQALLGCRNTITRNHPKLALAAYHNHKDMWRLARIIHEADPTYRFYLRYYGEPLLPTEFVLYAI